MGQASLAPCACSSQCGPLVHYADPASDTVKLDPSLLKKLDEIFEPTDRERLASTEFPELIFVEKDGKTRLASVPRCPRYSSGDAQAQRRQAMTEAAAAVAMTMAEEEAGWRSFEEKIRGELQAQRGDEARRRERRAAEKQQAKASEAAHAEVKAVETAEADVEVAEAKLATSLEEAAAQAVANSAMEEFDISMQPVTKSVLDTSCAEPGAEGAPTTVCTEDDVAKFLAAEKFKSVTSGRRRMLQTTYPLHVAVTRNDARLVRSLLVARANPSQRSGRLTAHQLAQRKNCQGSHDEVLSALESVS